MADEPEFVTLSDGRRLAYSEYGQPSGTPVLYFHGTPGTRLEAGLLDDAARRNGIRLIGVDRPGYGQSDPNHKHTLDGWVADVAQFADGLEIDRFGVVALSGGAPHAEACAALLPGRVTSIVIAGGAGPMAADLDGTRGVLRKAFARLGVAWFWLFAPLIAWWIALFGRRARPWMLRNVVDPAMMARPPMRATFARLIRESVRQGGAAMARELRLFIGTWRFTLADVRVQALLLHGEADRVVRVSVGRSVAAHLPACEARFYPNEGHLMIFDHGEEAMRFASRHAALRTSVR